MASFTNATGTSEAAELSLAEVLGGHIIEAAYSNVVARGTVRNESLAGSPSDVMKFPAWPALSAASVAETADLSNTAIDPTSVSLTVGEVGIMAAVTDANQEDDILSGLDGYARQLGRALADKMDADITALYTSFSNAVGDTTNGLSQEDFLNAIRQLDSTDTPGAYTAVIHPIQFAQLGVDIMGSGGAPWGGDSPQDSRFGAQGARAGTLFNVPIYQTTNVPSSTRTNAVYDGAIYSSEALAFVSKREARVEFERDASARLTEIVVTSRYTTGELVDDYGVVLYSRTTA